jgi:hypothetical protein
MELTQHNRKACPCCRGKEVYRSHRRGIVERYVLRAVQVRPYRCAACDNRFYKQESRTTNSSESRVTVVE